MAKGENHHGNRYPYLVKGILIELYGLLIDQVANYRQGKWKEIRNRQSMGIPKSHYPNSGMTSHQKNEIQN